MVSDSYLNKNKSHHTIKCRVTKKEKQLIDLFNIKVNEIIALKREALLWKHV